MSRMESLGGDAVADGADWIGRREVRWGALTPELAGMLNAAVSHDLSVERDTRAGARLPNLWHWAAFPEFVVLAELGRDGQPAPGGFLPPLPFARRMWAGGHLRFSGELRIGEQLRRRSEIASIIEKTGAAGPMVFVTVNHAVEGENGAFIEERQDIVYLDIPDRFTSPKKLPVPDDLLFDETLPMNEARLFRYSAATFNAHRIHYDLPYARDVEKYPALIVHGPMQATMLIEAAKRHTDRKPRSFSFRGSHPMFHDHALRLVGRPDPDAHAIDLGTAAPDGHLGMQARMDWD